MFVLSLTGTTLAFGGRIWWGSLAVAILALGLAVLSLLRMLLEGKMRLIASPLSLLGALALLLAIAQIAPVPPRVSHWLSPSSRAAYTVGLLPAQARALDPTIELPEGPAIRSPVSLDRPATLRWLLMASACLTVFWAASQFVDRLEHHFVILGSVIAGFFINSAVALVQLACGSNGILGFIHAGRGPAWGPSWNDLLESPGFSVLRVSEAARGGHLAWALPVPDRPFLIGTQMGGPDAYLALGSVSLPLALALTLQLVAPRGSREPFLSRLVNSGRGSVVALLCGMLVVSWLIVGLLAGPFYSVPFAIATVVVALPPAWCTGLRWTAVSLTILALACLAAGSSIGTIWTESKLAPPGVALESPSAHARVWNDALGMIRDFPLLGLGLGSFPAAYPYYKTQDATSTTAMSSLLQWGVESGCAGVALIALGAIWCLRRVPAAVRRVGTADRVLVFGLIGAGAGFTLFSAVHWTVELASVALAASAVGGICNRWLAGATDLFVEVGR
jgi:O-antigen ligase